MRRSQAAGRLWRQQTLVPFHLEDDLSNCCVTLLSHYHLYSTIAPSWSSLHLAASRERCWVNNAVFGWGRNQIWAGGSSVFSLHWSACSCIEIFSRLIAQPHNQPAVQQVLGTMKPKHTFSRQSVYDVLAMTYCIDCTHKAIIWPLPPRIWS